MPQPYKTESKLSLSLKQRCICHGTISIIWRMPWETTINHDPNADYYQFYYFFEVRYDDKNTKNSPAQEIHLLFGTAFCLSAVSPKTCFWDIRTHITAQNMNHTTRTGSEEIVREKPIWIWPEISNDLKQLFQTQKDYAISFLQRLVFGYCANCTPNADMI